MPEVQVTLFGPKNVTWTLRMHLSAKNLWPLLKIGQKLWPGLFAGIFLKVFWVCLSLCSGLSNLCLGPFLTCNFFFYSTKWEPSPLGLQYPPLFVEEFLLLQVVWNFRVFSHFSDLIPHLWIHFRSAFYPSKSPHLALFGFSFRVHSVSLQEIAFRHLFLQQIFL